MNRLSKSEQCATDCVKMSPIEEALDRLSYELGELSQAVERTDHKTSSIRLCFPGKGPNQTGEKQDRSAMLNVIELSISRIMAASSRLNEICEEIQL